MKKKYWLVGLAVIALSVFIYVIVKGMETSPPQADAVPTITDTFSTAAATSQAATPLPPTLAPAPIKPTQAAPTLPGIGSERNSDVDQMTEVFVPAGAFLMGSTDLEAKIMIEDGRAYPEIPQHTVTLDSFWIDKFEVTNGMYELCVKAGECEPPFTDSSDRYYWYYGNPEYSNYPVIWVSWYQAKAYCEWVGRRLPTEAEWEKAARGTEGQKYPWGNDPISGERVNMCDINCQRPHANSIYDDGYADTAPVGSYPAGASPYGAMDMAGNVSEWTSTLIQPYPYDASDGREDPDSPAERAWRSSPWSNGFWWMRATVRYRSVPFYQRDVLGFRCASSE
jgi:formylglycine-generating enzyme required for sulfatase activity